MRHDRLLIVIIIAAVKLIGTGFFHDSGHLSVLSGLLGLGLFQVVSLLSVGLANHGSQFLRVLLYQTSGHLRCYFVQLSAQKL